MIREIKRGTRVTRVLPLLMMKWISMKEMFKKVKAVMTQMKTMMKTKTSMTRKKTMRV